VARDIDDAKRDAERLEALLDVARLVGLGMRGSELHEVVAATVANAFGFRTVALNLRRPASGDYEVVEVTGSELARKALLGTITTAEGWEPLLDPRFDIEGAYFVPAGAFDWTIHTEPSFVPELRPLDHHDAWRPDDALFVPLRHSDSHLLGILSLDEPVDGMRPSAADLAVLAGLAAHLAQAVESAVANETTGRLLAKLRDAERRYRALVEQMPGIVYRASLTPGARWRSVGRQLEQILGFSPEEWLADGSSWLERIHDEDRAATVAALERTRLTGEPFSREYRMLAKDGRVLVIFHEAVVLQESDGPLMQGVLYDVSAGALPGRK
jgi:PAS domain S-box-containing protein